MSDITVMVERPLRWFGDSLPPGATLKVDPLQAQHLLDSGRARLVHAADAEQCIQAVRDDVKVQLRRAGGSQPAAPTGWPWRPA